MFYKQRFAVLHVSGPYLKIKMSLLLLILNIPILRSGVMQVGLSVNLVKLTIKFEIYLKLFVIYYLLFS